jgi:hypothetical protein
MFVFSFRYEGGEEEERDVFEELAARGASAGAPAIPVSQPPRHQPTITEVKAKRSSDEDFLCQKFTEIKMNSFIILKTVALSRVCLLFVFLDNFIFLKIFLPMRWERMNCTKDIAIFHAIVPKTSAYLYRYPHL